MPPEVTALLLIAVGAVLGVAVAAVSSHTRRRTWRAQSSGRRGDTVVAEFKKPDTIGQRQADAAEQLRIVMSARFSSRPLLNQSEARVFKELDRAVTAYNATWRVMAQVSLGEILRCADREAFGCINSKRVDLLLVDADCRPRYAIEYQGKAHYQSAAAARDAVKKEALRRAGIGYYEVVAGQTTPAELRRLVEKLIGDQPPNDT